MTESAISINHLQYHIKDLAEYRDGTFNVFIVFVDKIKSAILYIFIFIK